MRTATLFAVALALASTFATPDARADRPSHPRGEERGVEQHADAGISLDEAVNRAQRKYNARVIRAETRESQGRRVHVLRLLSEDGRVWNVKIDAASGAEI